MIKAIIFDCFGVLTVDDWQEFLDSLPADVDIEKVREVHRAYDAHLISKQDCANEIKKLTGKTFTEVDDVAIDKMPKNKQLLRFISTLRPKYKTAIASNIASNWIRDSFLNDEEQKLFDDMFFSFEIGAIKPSHEYFQYVLSKLQLPAHQVVLVDDKDRYCQVARQEDLKAVIYQNFEQMKTELEKFHVS